MTAGCCAQRREERMVQRNRQGLARARLDLRHDPPTVGNPLEQLVEQHRLADTAQTVEDPAAIALAELLGSTEHDVEGVEDLLPAGEQRRSSPSARAVGVLDRIHDQNLSRRIRDSVISAYYPLYHPFRRAQVPHR